MNSALLRQLWSSIEATQSDTLLELDQTTLVEQLLAQLQATRSLDEAQIQIAREYLHAKYLLIQDFALSRLAPVP